MFAVNHALTGALIGLSVGEPLIAIPAAVASHFVCDAIPHYGSRQIERDVGGYLRSSHFARGLLIDALLCGLVVLLLGIQSPVHWLLAAICAFAAAAPDFAWLPRYIGNFRGKTWRPGRFSKFAADIQWFQRPIGLVVEAAWFLGLGTVLIAYLAAS